MFEIKAEVIATIARIPRGWVATHAQIGVHLTVAPSQIASVVAGLDAAERAQVPWWRVVADGGAIGRHRDRDAQMTQLRDDGVLVSPAGIVQDLSARRLVSVAPLSKGEAPLPPPRPAASRSRGMRAKPTSTV